MNSITFKKDLLGVQNDLLRFAYKLTSDREEANDLLQETSLKALDNEDKYMPDTNFKGWIYTIMRNIFINNYRKVVRDQTFVDQTDNLYHLNLPRVDILYTHASDDRVLADAAIAAGAKGIVHAGSGNGSVHGQTEPALAEAVQKGIAVVLSSRTGSGVVCPNVEQYNKAGFIEGRTLNPQKARLLLQLALTKTNDPKEIARMFEEY